MHIKLPASWEVTECSVTGRYQWFWRTFCLSLQDPMFNPSCKVLTIFVQI